MSCNERRWLVRSGDVLGLNTVESQFWPAQVSPRRACGRSHSCGVTHFAWPFSSAENTSASSTGTFACDSPTFSPMLRAVSTCRFWILPEAISDDVKLSDGGIRAPCTETTSWMNDCNCAGVHSPILSLMKVTQILP